MNKRIVKGIVKEAVRGRDIEEAKKKIKIATVLTSFCSAIGVICCLFKIRTLEDVIDEMIYGDCECCLDDLDDE